MKKLFFQFNKIKFEKIIKIIYPLTAILIYMKFYFRLSINPSSFLYKKEILQQIVFTLSSIYFRIIEPIILLLIIKLLLEIVLLFYKKNQMSNSKEENH